MNNKQYRLQELMNPHSGHSLVIDTSSGLSLGSLPGLEDFEKAVTPLLPWADGVVTSPGQARRLATRTRTDAALLVSGDWTNAYRGQDFVLPPEHINYIPLLDASDARDLGASALVLHFLLGHEEIIDAQCLEQVVQLALEGIDVGIPLIVDVKPIGPRVRLLPKAIELGVSYALEGGADGVVIPWPGDTSLQDILTMTAGVPLWVQPESIDLDLAEVVARLDTGVTGFWLDERLFAAEKPEEIARGYHSLHQEAVEV